MNGSTGPAFEHTRVLTLDEAAREAARRRAPLRAHGIVDGHSIAVFFHGACVIHVDVQGLDTVAAIAKLLREPLRLLRVEFYRWPAQRTMCADWTGLRVTAERRNALKGSAVPDEAEAITRLGLFGVQM